MATVQITRDTRRFTIAASAARTATFTSDEYVAPNVTSLHVVIKVTAITDTPILTPKIEGKTALGDWYTVLAGTAIDATGTTVLKVGPGIEPLAGAAARDQLPTTWRLVLTATDADSATYSVAAEVFE